MIVKQHGVRAITSSDAEENTLGDLLLVRVPLRHEQAHVLVAGWVLVGCSVVASWGGSRGYFDAVYAFAGFEPSAEGTE